MKIALLCFGPFGKRKVNGSTTIARQLSLMLQEGMDDVLTVTVIEIPTVWLELKHLVGSGAFEEFDVIVGLGEGLPKPWHYIAVEQLALRVCQGNDVHGEAPPEDMLPDGPPFIHGGLCWNQSWVNEEHISNLGLGEGNPGALLTALSGRFLCNAAFYHILSWQQSLQKGAPRLGGFIHVPAEEEWLAEDESRTTERYGEVFAAFIKEIIMGNIYSTW